MPKYLFTGHSVRTVSAGVIISPRRNNYPRRAPGNRSKNFSRRKLTVPKIVAQCPKKSHSIYLYIETNFIAYLNTCIDYLNTCNTSLNTLTRLSLSAPYLNTLPIRLGNQENPRTPGARQPIRIDYYVTRVVSQEHSSCDYVTGELSAPGGPFSALGSNRLAIAYLNTWGTFNTPYMISSHSYYWLV